jgi:mono/diheme cytochrome c family protein
MSRFQIGRRVAVGVAVVAGAVALVTPAGLAQRNTPRDVIPASANIANGYKIFNTYFCYACHTMKAAGPMAYGQLGMNFNHIHAPYAVAVAAITNGLPAALPLYPTQMVGFGKVLTQSQIQDVAAFVAKYSGGYKTCSECATATTSSG